MTHPHPEEAPHPKPCYGSDLTTALVFAAEAFRHKTRKGSGTPYLTHLLAVAALVGEHGGTEAQMITALLHDVLEDIEDATHADLESRFGRTIADAVLALSDTTEHPKPSWKERKTRYLAKLADEPAFVKLVSAADKFHNLQSLLRDLDHLGEDVWQRFNAGKHEQLWYYRSVLEALGQQWESPLLAELRQGVSELEHRIQTS